MSSERKDATRAKIKDAARRLFGERGIDAVSVRDILALSNQKNVSAIGYYFRSKEELVKEIVVDGAAIVDRNRHRLLDALESSGKPIVLRDVIEAQITSMLMAAGQPNDEHYSRLFWNVMVSNPSFADSIASLRFDSGFRRVIAHIRKLFPEYPRQILNERISAMNLMLGAFFAMREVSVERMGSAPETASKESQIWLSETMIENLIDACVGLLNQPISPATAKLVVGGAGADPA